VHAKLYGHSDRQPEILAQHLPELITGWSEPPRWWFTRFGDPEPHLRLRIELSGEAGFGTAAQLLSTWADGLRHQGLLRDMQFAATYPETGRWGEGVAWDAAEEVFAADSRALAVQFAIPDRPKSQALTAAHFVSIACDFTGSTPAGMTWLIEHAHTESPKSVGRPLLKEAVRLADPADGWAALTAAPGGSAIADAWTPRREALARYRTHLTGADGIDPDVVLDSLLHAHHLRAVGIDPDDERTCRRLARAAALSWRARTTRKHG
jgi:thiopeptide-type bacteriocin biosynthesis protein